MYKILACILSLNGLFASSAVTYEFSGGRFGDNLISYMHAKWLSYEYDIPLLYRPFPYSSELKLSEKEISFEGFNKYQKIITLNDKFPRPIPSMRYIFMTPYFPEAEKELEREHYFTFKPHWKDEKFRKSLNEMIAPLQPLVLTRPPEDKIKVALHLRDGGTYDDWELHLKDPLKVPPLSFYIESLQKLSSLLQGKSIHCHVFTDAEDPQALIREIEEAVNSDVIQFNYRKKNNVHNQNVLEDFFSLFNFDILIRSESNYSIVPSLIKDYVVVVSPSDFILEGRTAVINKIKMDVNEDLLKKLLSSHE